jgi:hypothetical protein
VASDEPAKCVDLLSGEALGSKSAKLVIDTPGVCAPSGGAPSGGVAPAHPVTVCCDPEPEPE